MHSGYALLNSNCLTMQLCIDGGYSKYLDLLKLVALAVCMTEYASRINLVQELLLLQ